MIHFFHTVRLLLACIIICLCETHTSAQNTKRPNLKPITEEQQPEQYDTTRTAASKIRISGYDKTRTSSVESMLITNQGSDTIHAIIFTLTYFDSKGRQIHKRTEKVVLEIEPGETLNRTIRAWDRQQQWYYRRSQSAKKATRGTPFDVKIRIDGVN